MLYEVDELAVLRDLAAAEDRPVGMLYGCFGDESVIRVVLHRLAAPGERSSELPAGCDLPGVQCACRPALLVDSVLELLRVLEMAPAALQGQVGRRIPRDAHRRRVE